MNVGKSEEQEATDDKNVSSVESGPVQRIPVQVYEIADRAKTNAIGDICERATDRSTQRGPFDT